MSPERLLEIKEAARLRVRNWHEQRTASQKCHRCSKKTERAGWLCLACSRLVSAQNYWKRVMIWLRDGKCIECRKPSQGKHLCSGCRKVSA